MQMEFGKMFARLMARAIEREERELKQLRTEGVNSRVNEDTVRVYAESWFWPAFLKEALRDSACPTLAWENDRLDCCFLGTNGEPLAKFELKPLFPIRGLNRTTLGKIVEDFSKQWERSKTLSAVEHYVVLVPYGSPKAISTWVSEALLPAIKRNNLDIRVHELANSDPIELNRSNEGHAIVKTFLVTSASKV
jgi:hypothetical protein